MADAASNSATLKLQHYGSKTSVFFKPKFIRSAILCQLISARILTKVEMNKLIRAPFSFSHQKFSIAAFLDDFCGPMGLVGVCMPNGLPAAAPGCFPDLTGPKQQLDPFLHDALTSGCVGNGKTKKVMYDLLDNEEFDREEIPTYEEVARLFPRPGMSRPIVLIGAPGVGRNELKRRLMALEADRYKATIPRKLF